MNFPEEEPETVNAVAKLNPLVESLRLVGALNASEPVVEVEAVEMYIATRSLPLVQVVVVPSIKALVPL